MTAAQLTRELQDKRLRVEFRDGEIAEVRVLVVSECREHDECNGMTFDYVSTNRPDRVRAGSACWADARDISNFAVVGEPPE